MEAGWELGGSWVGAGWKLGGSWVGAGYTSPGHTKPIVCGDVLSDSTLGGSWQTLAEPVPTTEYLIV